MYKTEKQKKETEKWNLKLLWHAHNNKKSLLVQTRLHMHKS